MRDQLLNSLFKLEEFFQSIVEIWVQEYYFLKQRLITRLIAFFFFGILILLVGQLLVGLNEFFNLDLEFFLLWFNRFLVLAYSFVFWRKLSQFNFLSLGSILRYVGLFLIYYLYSEWNSHFNSTSERVESILLSESALLCLVLTRWIPVGLSYNRHTKNQRPECKYFVDEPVDIQSDLYNREEVSKQILRVINENDFESGFNIALVGSWGSGKSTILNWIVESSAGKLTSDAIFVPFSFIKFRGGNLVESFYSALLSRIEHYNSELGYLIRRFLWSYDSLSGKRIKNWYYDFVYGDILWNGSVELLNDIIRRSSLKVIVLIDDLDRLDGNELIEALNVLRSTKELSGIVFVIAFDMKILKAKLTSHNGQLFLDKYINLYIHLPVLPRESVFSQLRIGLNHSIDNDQLNSLILESCMKLTRGNRLNVADRNSVYGSWNEMEMLFKEPRIIKIFLNSIIFNFRNIDFRYVVMDEFILLQLFKLHFNDEWSDICSNPLDYYLRNEKGIYSFSWKRLAGKIAGEVDIVDNRSILVGMLLKRAEVNDVPRNSVLHPENHGLYFGGIHFGRIKYEEFYLIWLDNLENFVTRIDNIIRSDKHLDLWYVLKLENSFLKQYSMHRLLRQFYALCAIPVNIFRIQEDIVARYEILSDISSSSSVNQRWKASFYELIFGKFSKINTFTRLWIFENLNLEIFGLYRGELKRSLLTSLFDFWVEVINSKSYSERAQLLNLSRGIFVKFSIDSSSHHFWRLIRKLFLNSRFDGLFVILDIDEFNYTFSLIPEYNWIFPNENFSLEFLDYLKSIAISDEDDKKLDSLFLKVINSDGLKFQSNAEEFYKLAL